MVDREKEREMVRGRRKNEKEMVDRETERMSEND